MPITRPIIPPAHEAAMMVLVSVMAAALTAVAAIILLPKPRPTAPAIKIP